MASFEKYHPIMSAHYTMDWLTAARLKDVFALRQNQAQAALSGRAVDQTIEDSAHFVNQAMRQVMAGQSLLYSIAERKSGAFCGSFCLQHFSEDRTQAQLCFETLSANAHIVFKEVVPRMAGFGFFELGLTSVYALLPAGAADQITWFQALGFTKDADAEPAKVRLTKTAEAAKHDTAFQF